MTDETSQSQSNPPNPSQNNLSNVAASGLGEGNYLCYCSCSIPIEILGFLESQNLETTNDGLRNPSGQVNHPSDLPGIFFPPCQISISIISISETKVVLEPLLSDKDYGSHFLEFTRVKS